MIIMPKKLVQGVRNHKEWVQAPLPGFEEFSAENIVVTFRDYRMRIDKVPKILYDQIQEADREGGEDQSP